LKRSRMRRPRAWFAAMSSGRLGSASGPTTWLCLQWLDADRMKAGESQPDRGACRACPVPEARSPRPKSPRMERREATRFLLAEEAKQHICASRRSMPLVLGARLRDQLARCARVITRVYGSGCLKTESEWSARCLTSPSPLWGGIGGFRPPSLTCGRHREFAHDA